MSKSADEVSREAAERASISAPFMVGEILLDLPFRDSEIISAVQEGRFLRLVIRMDCYWSPGQPFGILTLVNAHQPEALLAAVRDTRTHFFLTELDVIRGQFGGRAWPLARIFENAEGTKPFKIPCSNFWFERAETYREHRSADESASFDADMRDFKS